MHSTATSSVATKQATTTTQQQPSTAPQQTIPTQTWVWAICGHRGRSAKHTCGSPTCNAIWGGY
jgi:hypothetical protein